MMRLPTLRRFGPAAIAVGAVVALSSTAVAQGADADTVDIADKAPFEQCLDGASPTTDNVEPVDLSQFDEIPHDLEILDTNPDYDEVVLDFDDELTNEEIVAYTESIGLDARLNSVFSDDANLFVAAVEEGAVPYIKDCIRASDASDKLLHIEENFEYRLTGQSVDVDAADTAGFGATDDTISTGDSPDFGTADFVPDDPLYQYQWNFTQVGAEQAWDVSTGQGTTVAVIDTGVTVEDDAERGVKVGPDLEDTPTVAGYDFVDDSDFVYDGHGHGTHVAGTIAQATDNSYGVAGLAYDAQIMPIRVLNDRGFGSVSDIADAVRFAADNGADVINLSLGGPLPSLVLKRALSYAQDQGTLVVAAAGNSGKKAPSYPAAFKEAFAVAATQYDQHTTFYSQWGDFVEIAAPGGNTRVDQNDDGRPDGILQETHPRNNPSQHEFALYMGTSMATPHVAAGAALVHSAGVTQPEAIKDVLRSTADDSMREHYDDDEYAQRYGAGFMQVDRAAQRAAQMTDDSQPQWQALDCEPRLVEVSADDDDDSLLAAVGAMDLTRMAGAAILVLLALLGLRRRDQFDHSIKEVATVGASATTVAFLFGLGASTNPIAASFILPLGAYALMAGQRDGRNIACGVGLGVAAFCLIETVAMTADVSWIPGSGGLLDRAWLMVNGLISLAIGFVGLRSE